MAKLRFAVLAGIITVLDERSVKRVIQASSWSVRSAQNDDALTVLFAPTTEPHRLAPPGSGPRQAAGADMVKPAHAVNELPVRTLRI
ncbi:hypothetical protein [Mycolicibacter nonchromogenicus]|uniref:hypothetical protein n=1 Tax=Mycolicibacter nonchromogenicus TaxID=1782 RepID=UPI00105687A6|nr:hypothetical protein [Mycolicibacter nonchromogenicus]